MVNITSSFIISTDANIILDIASDGQRGDYSHTTVALNAGPGYRGAGSESDDRPYLGRALTKDSVEKAQAITLYAQSKDELIALRSALITAADELGKVLGDDETGKVTPLQ